MFCATGEQLHEISQRGFTSMYQDDLVGTCLVLDRTTRKFTQLFIPGYSWGNSCIQKAQLHAISTGTALALKTRGNCLRVDREDFNPQLIWPFHWNSSKVQRNYWPFSIDNSLEEKQNTPKPNSRLCPEQKATTKEENRAYVKYVVGKKKATRVLDFNYENFSLLTSEMNLVIRAWCESWIVWKLNQNKKWKLQMGLSLLPTRESSFRGDISQQSLRNAIVHSIK